MISYIKTDNHSKYHPDDAFCGNIAPYEMAHLEYLVDQLTDEELKKLVTRLGIYFLSNDVPRDLYERVISEASTVDFYQDYHRILEESNKKNK